MPEEAVEIAVPVERLDLRGVLCPMNYVRTKLALERITQGECVEVFLDAGDPIRHVPSSITEEGHELLSVTPQESAFRVMIRKRSV